MSTIGLVFEGNKRLPSVLEYAKVQAFTRKMTPLFHHDFRVHESDLNEVVEQLKNHSMVAGINVVRARRLPQRLGESIAIESYSESYVREANDRWQRIDEFELRGYLKAGTGLDDRYQREWFDGEAARMREHYSRAPADELLTFKQSVGLAFMLGNAFTTQTFLQGNGKDDLAHTADLSRSNAILGAACVLGLDFASDDPETETVEAWTLCATETRDWLFGIIKSCDPVFADQQQTVDLACDLLARAWKGPAQSAV